MAWLGAALSLLLALPQGGRSADPEPPDTHRSATAALDAWRRDLAAPEQERIRGVVQLGVFESEKITAALLSTWQTAKSDELRLASAEALAAKRRAGTLPVFADMFDTSYSDRLSRAAAIGLGRHGDAGVALIEPRLAALAASKVSHRVRPEHDKRSALVAGLGVAATERAADLLARIASDSVDPIRHLALRELDCAVDTSAVRKARERAVRDPDVTAVVEALKQLDNRAWPGTKDAALDLHKRLRPMPGQPVDDVLVDVLARHLDPTTYAAFLVRAARFGDELEVRHGQALAKARAHAGFVTWLLVHGLVQETSELRVMAVRILAPIDQDQVKKALSGLVSADDVAVARAASVAVAALGDRTAMVTLRAAIGSGSGARRIEALFALHELLRGTPEWGNELRAHLASPVAELRAGALDLLAELHAEAALPVAHKLLDDEAWTVRVAACAYCRTVRSISSIPVLISQLAKEKGRVQEDVLAALEDLTAMRVRDVERWHRWWEENRLGFVLPPSRTEPRATPATTARLAYTTYHGIPVTSTHVTFVLDASGSMQALHGPGPESRLEVCKKQLERVLLAMPATTHCNLICFNSTVVADENRISEALSAVRAIQATGSTDIFAALVRAYADPATDTIYLLSDGRPNKEYAGPDAIVTAVETWNRTRKIRIHTIGFGRNRLLERLAELTGGECRCLD